MGTLVPWSLGTGTLCYFEGPTVFSESSRGRDGNVWVFFFYNSQDILAKRDNFLRLDLFLLLLLLIVYVCVWLNKWALRGPVTFIRLFQF